MHLASVDKLFAFLGLGVVRGDDPPQSPSDALRSAIDESGLGVQALAKAAGLDHSSIRGFVSRRGDLQIASVDKLFAFLGLGVVRGKTRRPEPKALSNDARSPIADALRSAIADRGPGVYKLARPSGIHDQTIGQFMHGRRDMMLASVDKLFAFLGLGVVRGDDPPQSPSDALRSAIAESGLNAPALAKACGLDHQAIRRFVSRRGDMYLSSVDKILGFLGVKVVRESKVRQPELKHLVNDPLRPLSGDLRSAIAKSGVGLYELFKRSGVSIPTIHRLIEGRNISAITSSKLANALGLGMEPARLHDRMAEVATSAEVSAVGKIDEGPSPWPHGTCPISWAADGCPVVNGHRKKIRTTQLRVIRALFEAGPKGLSGEELETESGRGGYRNILDTLAKDEDWAAIIRKAGGPRGRYRLAIPGTE